MDGLTAPVSATAAPTRAKEEPTPGLEPALLFPVGAGANTQWICTVDGNRTVFVNAADAAKHGLTQADSKAGVVFETKFGEENCHIESTP